MIRALESVLMWTSRNFLLGQESWKMAGFLACALPQQMLDCGSWHFDFSSWIPMRFVRLRDGTSLARSCNCRLSSSKTWRNEDCKSCSTPAEFSLHRLPPSLFVS